MAYGNLAYKNEYRREEEPQKNTNQPRKQSIAPSIASSNKKYIRYIVHIITLALSAVFMVSTFVTVHDTKAEVRKLNSKLREMEAVTSQKAFELEHSFDLSEIEEEATTRLGMQRPENYQYVYVNVKQEDVTEKTAVGEEGALKRFGEIASGFFGNIVNFFSIK